MIHTTHPQNPPTKQLCDYLKSDLGLDNNAISLGVKQSISENSPLSITLLTYGLISLADYEKLLDWLYTDNLLS